MPNNEHIMDGSSGQFTFVTSLIKVKQFFILINKLPVILNRRICQQIGRLLKRVDQNNEDRKRPFVLYWNFNAMRNQLVYFNNLHI